MSAAEWIDREEELVPAWADDEATDPVEQPIDEVEPEPPSPCSRCGDPTYVVGPLCDSCRAQDREKDAGSSLAALLGTLKDRIDRPQFKCRSGCGEPMVFDGQRCGACDWKETDRRERLECVARTNMYLPVRYRGNHFEGPELTKRVLDQKAIERARAAAKNPQVTCIVLVGPAGAGKTSLASASLYMLAYERKVGGRYCDARSLSIARSRHKLGEEPQVVADALSAGILLLDDVGLDDPAAHGSAVLDVLYARHLHSDPLVVTLACPSADLVARYGDGIGRRLLEEIPSNVVIGVKR